MSSAFDKCHFDLLFFKLEARLSAIVIRALIFIYEKQFAWVRLENQTNLESSILEMEQDKDLYQVQPFSVFIYKIF